MSRCPPPKKQNGQAKGQRKMDGEIRSVATQALTLGVTEKQLRAQVNRGLIPYRRLGGRIVFLADEVTAFLRQLPGVTTQQALENIAARQSDPEGGAS